MKMKGVRSGNKSGCHGRKAYAHGGRVMAYANGGVVGDEADEFMNDAADQANMVDGVPVRQRLDRPMPKSGKATNITINVGAPKAEVETPKVPPVVPPGIPPMAGAPPMPPPMNVGGPPPGGVPMRANGGRVKKADGGSIRSEDEYYAARNDKPDWGALVSGGKRLLQGKDYVSRTQSDPSDAGGQLKNMKTRSNVTTPTKRANGGRVDMDAGAGGGLGRLEKVKDYGAKAGKPAK